MCTAIMLNKNGAYFGRNLDCEHTFGEQYAVTPRNYPLKFKYEKTLFVHKALSGVACVKDGYPLYFDAVNENGLYMAGLNFVGNARFFKPKPDKYNIAQYEIVPWLLGQCADLSEARALLSKTNITDDGFSPSLPAAQLHWFAADKGGSVAVESTADGLNVWENPADVLTNNPPFPEQMKTLEKYAALSPRDLPKALQTPQNYSRGTGGVGLPGDLTSGARFVRAAYLKKCVCDAPFEASINTAFDILDGVKQLRGCCITESGEYEYTRYSSCCNAQNATYAVAVYESRTVRSFDMRPFVGGREIVRYSFYAE